MRAAVYWTGVVLLIALGTTATVGLYSLRWGGPEPPFLTVAGVLAAHLWLCGTYMVMGESLIEDAVKSVIVVILGGMLLAGDPIDGANWDTLLGLLAFSLAICAFVAAQGLQWAYRK